MSSLLARVKAGGLSKLKVTPLVAGLVLGLGAALVQAYFKVIPPLANGFCFVCHPRDLVNWISNALFHTGWDVSMVSLVFPVLTVVGVVLGSLTASARNGEFKLRPARHRVKNFVYGFLMINFGLLLAACPIRIVLLSAYGDPVGLAGWLSIVLGVAAVTILVRFNARRSANRGELK